MTATTPDTAIERILEAEQDARQAVETCQRQADGLLDEGLARARRVTDRADERIGLIHARADAGIDRALARLEEQLETLAGRPAVDEADWQRLDGAVEALIRELVGEAR
jgi:vacuolar-type H+-ATPase subunit H